MQLMISVSDIPSFPATATWPLAAVFRDLVNDLDPHVGGTDEPRHAESVTEVDVRSYLRQLQGLAFLHRDVEETDVWIVNVDAATDARRRLMRLPPNEALAIADRGEQLGEKLHQWTLAGAEARAQRELEAEDRGSAAGT